MFGSDKPSRLQTSVMGRASQAFFDRCIHPHDRDFDRLVFLRCLSVVAAFI